MKIDMLKRIFFFLCLFILCIFGFININYRSDGDLYSFLIKDISKRDENFESIIKIKYKNDLYFVMYQDNSFNNHLLIYEENDNLFSNKYSFWGDNSSSFDINTYKYRDDNSTLIVIYGNNDKAKSYTFINQGKLYNKKISSEYILDVYFVNSPSFDVNNLTFYDNDGNQITIENNNSAI